jgi:ankyrin repeat protein
MLRAFMSFALAMTAIPALAEETLFSAATKGDTAAIERLLADGGAADIRAADQATPLIAAALAGQAMAAELLIAKGADVMARNSGGFTPLHAAAYSGNAAVATLLLDHNAVRDDTANKAGASPLFVAAEMNNGEVVELLIAKGADADQVESHGYMATTRAFWKGHFDMVRLLKRHGAVCQESALGPDDYKRCLEIKD